MRKEDEMRKVILLMGMGLDGVGAHGWSPPIADEAAASELHEDMWKNLKSVDTFIFGRVNYNLWKEVWPPLATSPSSSEFEKRFSRITDDMKKIVVSSTLKSVDWPSSADISLITEDVSKEIGELKQQTGKDMVIVGGPKIAQTFTKLNLVDEYHIYLHPMLMGEGTTLLGGLPGTRRLDLTKAKMFKAGVVGLQYGRPIDGER
jgi:dihydrofolate reductase